MPHNAVRCFLVQIIQLHWNITKFIFMITLPALLCNKTPYSMLWCTYRVERGAGLGREWPRKWSAGAALGTSVSAAVGCSDLEDDSLAVRLYLTDPPSGCSHVYALLLSAWLRDENECQNIFELLSKLLSLFVSFTARQVLACLYLTHFLAVSVWLKGGCQQRSDQGHHQLAQMNAWDILSHVEKKYKR